MRIKRIVDCSQPLFHNAPGWPDPAPAMRYATQIKIHLSHFIPRDGFNLELVEMNTHFGTHIDTPWHQQDDGKNLDEIPLTEFVGEGVVIDASGVEPSGDIALEDVKPRYDKEIRDGDMAIICTGWGQKRGLRPTTAYCKQFPALSVECAKWLVQKRVKAVGIDTLSFDKYGSEGAPVHNVLFPAVHFLIEDLYLPKELLEKKRWWFSVLPLAFVGVGGAWCRAVAIEWE